MNPLFWLTIVVTSFTAYQVGRFVTLRNIKVAADKLMASLTPADLATKNPIGAGLAREMGIEL
jgi:hypothetical protein